MSTEPRNLNAVRGLLRDRSAVAAAAAPTPAHAPRASRKADALHAMASTGNGGMVELLWNERRVESYALTHRIAIPLAGRPATAELAEQLTTMLSAWWVDAPGVLSNGTGVTFVSVEAVDAPLSRPELVVTLTTDAPVGASQVANLRTIRDLRRAMRDVRRTSRPVAAHLALLAA